MRQHIQDSFAKRRANMVRRLAGMGIHRPEVLAAMGQVERHLFVEEVLHTRAYDDISLPLGLGQTISQPYTVALMTQLMLGTREVSAFGRILEIGTGCAYQTAVLQLVGLREVYSVERLAPLYEKAKRHLRAAGLAQGARLVCGDGYLGLPQAMPFDGILVTAAPSSVPVPLLEQLAVGGRMVLPLDEDGRQHLWLIEKTEHGFHETCVQEARFVPLVNGR